MLFSKRKWFAIDTMKHSAFSKEEDFNISGWSFGTVSEFSVTGEYSGKMSTGRCLDMRLLMLHQHCLCFKNFKMVWK